MNKKCLSQTSLIWWAVVATACLAAQVSAKPTVVIGSPTNGLAVSGKQVSLSVSWLSDTAPVASLELLINGQRVYTKKLAEQSRTGSYAFYWDTTALKDGVFTVGAKAFDSAGESGFASVTVYVTNQETDVAPPTVAITKPRDGETVSGMVEVAVDAHDNKLLDYVFLFIDDALKQMKNFGPFTYPWNTTRERNGAHKLTAKALDASKNQGLSPVVTVIVNNEGGATPMGAPLFRAVDEPPSSVSEVDPAKVSPEVQSVIVDPGHVAQAPAPAATTKAAGDAAAEVEPSLPTEPPSTPSAAQVPPQPETEEPSAKARAVAAPPSAVTLTPVKRTQPARSEGATKAEVPQPQTPVAVPRAESPAPRPAPVLIAKALSSTAKVLPALPRGLEQQSVSAPSRSGIEMPTAPTEVRAPRPAGSPKSVAPSAAANAAEAPGATPQMTVITRDSEPRLRAVEVPPTPTRQTTTGPTVPRPGSVSQQSASAVPTNAAGAPQSAEAQKPVVAVEPKSPTESVVKVPEPAAVTRVAKLWSPTSVEPRETIAVGNSKPTDLPQPEGTRRQTPPAHGRRASAATGSPAVTQAAPPRAESLTAAPGRLFALAAAATQAREPIAGTPPSTSAGTSQKVGRIALAMNLMGTSFPEKPTAIPAPSVGPSHYTVPDVRGVPSGLPVAGSPTVRRSYTVRPGDTLTKIALLHNVSVVDLALSNGLKDTNAVRTGHSLVIPNRSLKVFYDSHPITLDVVAFAQAGIALAPFRPIFEHAGGTVTWSHKDKRLEAKNDDHTVEIRIGSETAQVDGEAVMLELAALIKQSRTMVPTSLFSKVMNVEVSFDAETGHVMVASK